MRWALVPFREADAAVTGPPIEALWGQVEHTLSVTDASIPTGSGEDGVSSRRAGVWSQWKLSKCITELCF